MKIVTVTESELLKEMSPSYKGNHSTHTNAACTSGLIVLIIFNDIKSYHYLPDSTGIPNITLLYAFIN